MLRLLLVVAAAVGLAQAGFLPSAGTVANKFIVTYSVMPDPFHLFSFYTMPRTIQEAEKDSFTQEAKNDDDKTTLWCRERDHRVCVLFDQQGSVAGIQVSVKVSEATKNNAPLDIPSIPEWRTQNLLGEEVYSSTAYFVSKDVLQAGGRPLNASTLTAPDGLYLLQTNNLGDETGRLHVDTEQQNAEAAGFNEQSCFLGMGKHYFQNLSKEGTCEAHRPYFLLFGPKTKQLQGFGFVQYGKVSQGRGWFETPPALVAKTIAPNSPDCMSKWINKYGLFTMHVFFVEKPYLTMC